jgi:hypothetical protein
MIEKILLNINYLTIFKGMHFSTYKEKMSIDFAWQLSMWGKDSSLLKRESSELLPASLVGVGFGYNI